jgi:hypothetical protein
LGKPSAVLQVRQSPHDRRILSCTLRDYQHEVRDEKEEIEIWRLGDSFTVDVVCYRTVRFAKYGGFAMGRRRKDARLRRDERRLVRINCELHREHRVSLLDTLLHEGIHVQYPFLSERMVCELTKASLPCLTARDKAQNSAPAARW